MEDSRIDWTWPAEDLDRLVRAQSDPYPNAFTYHRGQRIRIVAGVGVQGLLRRHPRAGSSSARATAWSSSPARRPAAGRSHGLVVERVRTEDGTELAATDYFTTMGGYLTARR